MHISLYHDCGYASFINGLTQDGLVQECSNLIANELELPLSHSKPLVWSEVIDPTHDLKEVFKII